MLVSPLASSTSPATVFIAQEPSWRWLRSHQEYAASAASTSPATSSAIAASTWFQTSTCSPVVHGTAPSGSCIDAIEAAVWATCALDSTPVTDGIGWERVTERTSPACAGRAPCSCRSAGSAPARPHG